MQCPNFEVSELCSLFYTAKFVHFVRKNMKKLQSSTRKSVRTLQCPNFEVSELCSLFYTCLRGLSNNHTEKCTNFAIVRTLNVRTLQFILYLVPYENWPFRVLSSSGILSLSTKGHIVIREGEVICTETSTIPCVHAI